MTSEVCVMNRHAVVLAADSATTVTGWISGKRETRYFKGANKILQLSECQPVGLMIFDGADVLNVPWEVVVKAFRAQLEKKSFNTIEGYAAEFFNFLEADARLFPPEVQHGEFVSSAVTSGLRYAWDISGREDLPLVEKTAAFDAYIVDRRAAIDAAPLNHGLTAEHAAAAVAAALADTIDALEENLSISEEPMPTDMSALAELALWRALKQPEEYLQTTGLVFAGYGDHDIFPSHVHYVSCGIVNGKHLSRRAGGEAITHEIPANLQAFAQRGMIDTFQIGIDLEVYVEALTGFDQALRTFGEEIVNASGGDLNRVADLEPLVRAARDQFTDKITNVTRAHHALPLRRVLASLPISEMAELAETLVNLQSLKEKVTKPSEEVGGPIDVAVITKSEGLVWIRRKHYFDPELNARYMARLGRT